MSLPVKILILRLVIIANKQIIGSGGNFPLLLPSKDQGTLIEQSATLIEQSTTLIEQFITLIEHY